MKDLDFFLEGHNGNGVLLIHGLTGAPAEMRLVARNLNRKGYTVYAPLLAGHGQDKATLIKTRWQDWLKGVEEAATTLHSHVHTVFTAGICVGGKLGMMLAKDAPDLVKACAVYSPCFHYDGWGVPFYYPLLSSNIGWLSRIPFLDRLSFHETPSMGIKDERLRRMMQNLAAEGVIEDFPGKSLVEMHRLGKAFKKALPQMSAPSLILHASEDDLSSPRQSRYIAEHIGAPHELIWIDNSYHMIHVDRSHKRVADLTAEFFEKAAHG